MSKSAILRARWVLPVDSDPIEDGEVIIESGRIAEIRSSRPGDSARDFGNSILLPGLVNVHAHMDYTVMRGLLEDIPFFEWIRELTLRKAALDENDWIASATMGAAEAVAGGVTTIGDCTDSGCALTGAKALGLRGIIYQEVFAADESVPVSETLSSLEEQITSLRANAAGSHLQIGVSPHAPYTVRPEAMRAIAAFARDRNLPMCIHAAESQAEVEWLRHGGGCIGDRDVRRGIRWNEPARGCTPLELLEECGALSASTLLVHGVQISARDRDIIRETRAAWAHCPKSNAKLGNGIVPLHLLRQSYPEELPRIGLGSDSVVSNNTMDLFEEMRFAVLAQRAASRNIAAMTARDAVVMATLGGAAALGMGTEIGSLTPGKQADITVVSLDGLAATPAHDPYAALVYAASARDVRMTIVGGDTVYESGSFNAVDLDAHQVRMKDAARRVGAWSPQGE